MKRLILPLFFFIVSAVYAQEPPNEPVKIFRAGSVINMQTPELTPRKGFNLDIQHKFGEVDLKEKEVINDFFGFDLSSNIRFGFTFPLTKNGQIGIGRTKNFKAYDLNAKYLFYAQKENGIPLSVALYARYSYFTIDLPEPPKDFFDEAGNPWTYSNIHRISYLTELIIASKLNKYVSLAMNPTLVYRNYTEIPTDDNYRLVIPIGAKIRTSLSGSVLLEFHPYLNKRPEDVHHFGLGYEINTASHVFQIFLNSSSKILEDQLYYHQGVDISKMQFYIGFNMYRTFYFK